MPTVSRFSGVVIYMYRDDHNPPHFHALVAEHEAQISIDHPAIIVGTLPRRLKRQVLAWARKRHAELAENWRRTHTDEPLLWIEP